MKLQELIDIIENSSDFTTTLSQSGTDPVFVRMEISRFGSSSSYTLSLVMSHKDDDLPLETEEEVLRLIGHVRQEHEVTNIDLPFIVEAKPLDVLTIQYCGTPFLPADEEIKVEDGYKFVIHETGLTDDFKDKMFLGQFLMKLGARLQQESGATILFDLHQDS